MERPRIIVLRQEMAMEVPAKNSQSRKFPVGYSTHSCHSDEGPMGAVDVLCSTSGLGW